MSLRSGRSSARGEIQENNPSCARYENQENWLGHCATSMHQSPINIMDHKTVLKDMGKLHCTECRLDHIEIKELDCDFHVMLPPKHHNCLLWGAGLKGDYKLAEMRFHWGAHESSKGSEHQIDSHSWTLEGHFIYHHTDYPDLHHALGEANAVVAIAVFYHAHDDDDDSDAHDEDLYPQWHQLEHALEHRLHNESYENMLEEHDVMDFMPREHMQNFYHYSGSMTVPDCNHVLWYVMEHDVHMPKDLVHEFEHLSNITMNSRDLQKVNDRMIYKNDHHDEPLVGNEGATISASSYLSLFFTATIATAATIQRYI